MRAQPIRKQRYARRTIVAVGLLLAACEGSDRAAGRAPDASAGADAGDGGGADAALAVDASEPDPCTCGCARYTLAPADCRIDWDEALGGGSSLDIEELVVELGGARVPRVLDAESCHPSLGGFYAFGSTEAKVLALCETTCTAILPAKPLLLHPACR